MTAGRPRKPTKLHAVQGTYRSDRHGTNEPDPPVASLKPPAWLDADGRKVWRDLAPGFIEMGVLTEVDVEAFAHACSKLATARREQSTYSKAFDQANQVLARFGWTPSDRAKVSVQPKKTDTFADKFLGKAK